MWRFSQDVSAINDLATPPRTTARGNSVQCYFLLIFCLAIFITKNAFESFIFMSLEKCAPYIVLLFFVLYAT